MFTLKPRPERFLDFFMMVTKIKGGNGPLFLLNMMCIPYFLPIIWIKFTKRLLSRKLNRINFPKTLLTHELIRFNFFFNWVISRFESTFRKSCWVMSRFESNFWKKLLSRELIRLNFQNFQFDSNPKKLSRTQVCLLQPFQLYSVEITYQGIPCYTLS